MLPFVIACKFSISNLKLKKFACHGQESNLRHPDHNRMYYHYTTAAKVDYQKEIFDNTEVEYDLNREQQVIKRKDVHLFDKH